MAATIMRILIVIGAGASHDCWPSGSIDDEEEQRLPLAKELFSRLDEQNRLLQTHNLSSISSRLRLLEGDSFDIELELEKIRKRASDDNDPNDLQLLFATRFYFRELISNLTVRTLGNTHNHTSYVDLLNNLKAWIQKSPDTRFVDIVTFNYDTLLESAMSTVYPSDWNKKNINSSISSYYKGNNLRIYKPHGSTSWGRELGDELNYTDISHIVSIFEQAKLDGNINPVEERLYGTLKVKHYVPALAIPFKGKSSFECPSEMQKSMLEAIATADKLITLGWKGAEKHFTDLLKAGNSKIDEMVIVSPTAETELAQVYPDITPNGIKTGFSKFARSKVFGEILDSFTDKNNHEKT